MNEKIKSIIAAVPAKYIYYKNAQGVIINADSRTVLPLLRGGVDVCITDPVWPNCPPGLLKGSAAPEKLLKDTLRHVKTKRLIVVMRNDSDPRFLRSVPARYPYFKLQILSYVIPSYHGRKLGGDEIAYCFGTPLPASRGKKVIPTYGPRLQPQDRENRCYENRKIINGKVLRKKTKGHPCSRALKHFEWLIDWWTLPGDVVLDPFAGGGTTLSAANIHGRYYIGIEIEKKYCKLAKEKIIKDEKQMRLFV